MDSVEKKRNYHIENVHSGLQSLRDNGNLRTVLSLNYNYAELANLALCTDRNSATIAKRYFFKAARSWQLYNWYHLDMYKPKYVYLNPKNPFIGPMLINPEFFLLCDFEDFRRDYYSSVEIPKRKLKHAGFCMGLAHKFLLMGEKEEAKLALGDAYRKGDATTKDFALLLGGIVNEDISLIEKGLAFRRKETIRINNGTLPEDILMSDRVTAWVKLARQFGLEPDITKGMIHEKILEHEDMEFEDIDEVYEAIGLEPIKRYPLRNY